jgi:hypothetical protein
MLLLHNQPDLFLLLSNQKQQKDVISLAGTDTKNISSTRMLYQAHLCANMGVSTYINMNTFKVKQAGVELCKAQLGLAQPPLLKIRSPSLRTEK